MVITQKKQRSVTRLIRYLLMKFYFCHVQKDISKLEGEKPKRVCWMYRHRLPRALSDLLASPISSQSCLPGKACHLSTFLSDDHSDLTSFDCLYQANIHGRFSCTKRLWCMYQAWLAQALSDQLACPLAFYACFRAKEEFFTPFLPC